MPLDPASAQVMSELCTQDGQTPIRSLSCYHPTTKQELIEKTQIELPRLNELLLLFTENRVIEFEEDNRVSKSGYLISSHSA